MHHGWSGSSTRIRVCVWRGGHSLMTNDSSGASQRALGDSLQREYDSRLNTLGLVHIYVWTRGCDIEAGGVGRCIEVSTITGYQVKVLADSPMWCFYNSTRLLMVDDNSLFVIISKRSVLFMLTLLCLFLLPSWLLSHNCYSWSAISFLLTAHSGILQTHTS